MNAMFGHVITINPWTYIRRHHPILWWHSHWRTHRHGSSWRGARARPWRLTGNFHWTGRRGAILLCFCQALGCRSCWWWWWIWLVLLLLHGATPTSFSPTRDIYQQTENNCSVLSTGNKIMHISFTISSSIEDNHCTTFE